MGERVRLVWGEAWSEPLIVAHYKERDAAGRVSETYVVGDRLRFDEPVGEPPMEAADLTCDGMPVQVSRIDYDENNAHGMGNGG